MTSLHIDILNPKAEKLIKDLEDLKLIQIRKNPRKEFIKLVKVINAKSKGKKITLEEINKEVKIVRARRNAKKSK